MNKKKQHYKKSTENPKEFSEIKKQVLNEIKNFYLSSDFNGLSVNQLNNTIQIEKTVLKRIFEILIEEEKITLLYSEFSLNPHIKAFPEDSIQTQLERLSKSDLNHVCAYPSSNYLKQVVNPNDFNGKPYELELALGTGKLEFKSFDLSILEIYRNDPRYHYDNDDISGNICINDEFFESIDILQRDQILLKSFGFSYDDDFNRAAAVFLVYLSKLSPEHQQIWKAKELRGSYKLHPDYFRNSYFGEIGEKISIFDAFIEELRIINEMCACMKRPNLFRNTFVYEKPKNFSFLIRPTLNEYNFFILTLDQMMSDNINKNFFKGDVYFELEVQRNDGKIIVTQKGTIQLLEEWLNNYVQASDRKPIDDLILVFRTIRKKRQDPAHSIKQDEFNQEYFHKQRKLIMDAYGGIRQIRLIFANDLNVKSANIKISEPVFKGEIWTI